MDEDCDVGDVAGFEFDNVYAKEWSDHARSTSKVIEISTNNAKEQKSNLKKVSTSKRRPPLPPRSNSTYDIKNQIWRQNRPVMVRERAVEVEPVDSAPFFETSAKSSLLLKF
jgi:hypothetical protein